MGIETMAGLAAFFGQKSKIITCFKRMVRQPRTELVYYDIQVVRRAAKIGYGLGDNLFFGHSTG
jgi:hypothetical protein